MAATEIKRGDFVYRDTLFIDLGPTKRHPRASESELRALLLPKKASAPTEKDQVAHYYEAQLLHYGLNRTKDKDLAKVRLTQALNSGALKIPAWVSQTEKDMRKEWLAAVKREGKVAEPKPSAGRKRKADESEGKSVASGGASRKIKVMVEVDLSDDAGTAAPTAKAKKQKVEADMAGKGKAKAANAVKPTTKEPKAPKAPKASKEAKASKVTPVSKAATAQKATKAPSSTTSASKPIRAADQTSASSARPKQLARRGGGFAGSTQSARPAFKQSSPTKSKQSYDPSDYHLNSYSASDSDTDLDDAPPPAYDTHDFSAAATVPSNNVVQISGIYYVLEAHTSDDTFDAELTIRLDKITKPSSPTLWAIFLIPGKLRCVFTTDSPNSALSGSRTEVVWRAEDFETGQALFRRDCVGEVSFDGTGKVDLVLWELVDGRQDLRVDGVLESVAEGEGWGWQGIKGEWGAIARRAYGGRGH